MSILLLLRLPATTTPGRADKPTRFAYRRRLQIQHAGSTTLVRDAIGGGSRCGEVGRRMSRGTTAQTSVRVVAEGGKWSAGRGGRRDARPGDGARGEPSP